MRADSNVIPKKCKKCKIFSTRERKKTAVHGTLGMAVMAWKFNSKQLLCKTLNSRINIIETRAVSNIVQKDGNYVLEDKREGLEIILT